jgi:hypothetical protein
MLPAPSPETAARFYRAKRLARQIPNTGPRRKAAIHQWATALIKALKEKQ